RRHGGDLLPGRPPVDRPDSLRGGSGRRRRPLAAVPPHHHPAACAGDAVRVHDLAGAEPPDLGSTVGADVRRPQQLDPHDGLLDVQRRLREPGDGAGLRRGGADARHPDDAQWPQPPLLPDADMTSTMRRPLWLSVTMYAILAATSLIILYPLLFMVMATFTTT